VQKPGVNNIWLCTARFIAFDSMVATFQIEATTTRRFA
jgi:hypothetical protein